MKDVFNGEYMKNNVIDINTNNKRLPRMRTIPKAFDEIKKIDPDTSFTIRALRKLVNNGDLPAVKISNKVLINLDVLLDLLSGKCYNNNATCV